MQEKKPVPQWVKSHLPCGISNLLWERTHSSILKIERKKSAGSHLVLLCHYFSRKCEFLSISIVTLFDSFGFRKRKAKCKLFSPLRDPGRLLTSRDVCSSPDNKLHLSVACCLLCQEFCEAVLFHSSCSYCWRKWWVFISSVTWGFGHFCREYVPNNLTPTYHFVSWNGLYQQDRNYSN